MKTLQYMTQVLRLLLVAAAVCGSSQGQTSSRLSSSFLARGEQALLEIMITGGQPAELPRIPAVKNLAIQPSGRDPLTRMLPGRRLEYVFQYIVASYETGTYTIPPIQVTVDGVKTFTESLDLMVFNPDELQWTEMIANGKPFRYASAFRILNPKPFENESTTTEIKLFVPEDLVIEDWGIPDFERDGLTSWRFQPMPMRSRINLLGRSYVSVAYPSTITPTRTGKVGIGPAKIRLVTREVVMDPTPRWINTDIYVQVPKLELESIPLPDGAPAGFENAVGSFRLSATSATTDVQEGDPLTVDLIVSGSGNLDTLSPPQLESTAGWKVYGTTTEQRGDERRQLSGSVVFHQSIRPLELKSEIPRYQLIYFDPRDESYKTLTTEPIALQMRPNTALKSAVAGVQSLPMPLERMTDILAVLKPAQLTIPLTQSLPSWLGHAAGGLLALTLVIKALWMRYGARLRRNPAREAKLQELLEIERNKPDDATFLKSTGSFIERHLGTHPDPQIHAILAERDAVCFRAEPAKITLDPQRRSAILNLLRKAIPILAILTITQLATPARAADLATRAQEAYDSAKYDEALKLWFEAGSYDQLAPDTLYNIGNACYRSGSPGYAALYYRRALVRDSSHQEARQNLRFLEQKYGAITVKRPDYQYALARFPLSTWKAACWTGIWLCILSLLVFPATRPGARLRIAAAATLVLGPLLISVGMIGWRHFPDDAEFAELARQAVIIEEKVALHTDAARTAPEVIDAPPGSLCEIITLSGRWAYVAFATKTRGWVPIETIEKVLPDKPPEVPKFRKPKPDGKTASYRVKFKLTGKEAPTAAIKIVGSLMAPYPPI
jgi:tetratricopeptide (TPR) repeat protein